MSRILPARGIRYLGAAGIVLALCAVSLLSRQGSIAITAMVAVLIACVIARSSWPARAVMALSLLGIALGVRFGVHLLLFSYRTFWNSLLLTLAFALLCHEERP